MSGFCILTIEDDRAAQIRVPGLPPILVKVFRIKPGCVKLGFKADEAVTFHRCDEDDQPLPLSHENAAMVARGST